MPLLRSVSTGKPSLPRGLQLLQDPRLNKGTAFSEREREALGLRGLLPPAVSSQEEQVERILENVRRLPGPLEKYIALTSVRDRNETLFYRVLVDHIEEMMPIIYTPTVGVACQQYGHIFRRPRGVFISLKDRGRVAQVLRNWPQGDIAVIVVSDGERILGLGDLGANGMGIPIGKLALYTACAGVPPERCLPVMIDVGTNNQELLEDPLYIGLRQKRATGAEYEALVDEFMQAVGAVFPGALVQFEDFGNHNAFHLLEKYRNAACVFNDDIQGTAAVALAGIFSAERVTCRKLQNERILFMGAGEAATGIADLIVSAMVARSQVPHEARRRNWLFDSHGLVVKGRSGLAPHKLPYAHDEQPCTDFLDAVRRLHPTAIIGVAAVSGAFTPAVLKAMAALNARPIVFALSNPTSKSECTAEQAYASTDGYAMFCSGSPFEPFAIGDRQFVPRQGNNSYIFPGLGLGIVASGAKRVTDEMFMAAAETLADQVTQSDLDQGSLFPALSRIREVSAKIATAVAEVAYGQGLATGARPDDLAGHVRSIMYTPRYDSYVPA